MRTDVHGVSTCAPGAEEWEEYWSPLVSAYRVQYDYRTPEGELFACVAKSLEAARERRDKWLAAKSVERHP